MRSSRGFQPECLIILDMPNSTQHPQTMDKVREKAKREGKDGKPGKAGKVQGKGRASTSHKATGGKNAR
jgi:hypothetical protein